MALAVHAVAPMRLRAMSSMQAKVSTSFPLHSCKHKYSAAIASIYKASPVPSGASDRPVPPPSQLVFRRSAFTMSAGMQVTTSASTVVLPAVLNASEQCVRIFQQPVS